MVSYPQPNLSGLSAFAGRGVPNLGLRAPDLGSGLASLGQGIERGIVGAREQQRADAELQMKREAQANQMKMQQARMAMQKQQFDKQSEAYTAKLAAENTEEELKAKSQLGQGWLSLTPEEKVKGGAEFIAAAVERGDITEEEGKDFIQADPVSKDIKAKSLIVGAGQASVLKKSKGQTINIEAALPKAAKDYMWQRDEETGQMRQEPIPGTKADKENIDTVAKIVSGEYGLKDIGRVKKSIINPDRSINRKNLAAMNLGIPFTEGRATSQAMERSLMGKLRIDTGAAISDQELINYDRMFTPSMFDSDASIRNKLEALEYFHRNVSTAMRKGMSATEKADVIRDIAGRAFEETAKARAPQFTDEQIQAAATKYGKTPEQVRADIKQRGR